VTRGAPALAALIAAVLLAGCGGDDPTDVLSQTAKNLGKVRSGDLSMGMSIAAGPGGGVGFALAGPFALPASGGMPRARVAYTQIAGPRRATVTLTSTGSRAYVTANGRTRRLSAAQARRLRVGPGTAGQQLKIGDWVRDPKLADGPTLDGAQTQRLTARLDVRAAARDLLRVAGALGPGTGALGQSRGDLDRAVKSSSFELITGKDDRLLRRLRIGIDLRVPGGRQARVRFALGVRRPNEPVRIAAPAA
jgi:hypothetical protein